MNKTISSKLNRCSIRIPGYDYTRAGAYYVTMVTAGRECIFGEVAGGVARLSKIGEIARREWERLPGRFPGAVLDEYVIMPNHIHGIIVLSDCRGTASRAPTGTPMVTPALGDSPTNMGTGTASRAPTTERFGKPVAGSIPTIIRSYKSAVTKQFNEIMNQPGAAVWQRNYYEHIIRDREDLDRITAYIQANPANWEKDEEYR